LRIISYFTLVRRENPLDACVALTSARYIFVLLATGLLMVAIGLTGCSRSKNKRIKNNTTLSKRVIAPGQPVPKGGGRYKVGNPYQVQGRWYYPKENTRYSNVGTASWYGDMFHGRYTANGEIFDMNALTAAHPTLPMPVYAQVTNLENGRSIVVRINDRGPYAHNREIDLSKQSARVLGVYRAGTAKVRVRYLGKAPLNGDDSYERRVLASKPWGHQYASNNKAPKIYARAVVDSMRKDATPVQVARLKKSDRAGPMTVGSIKAPEQNIKTDKQRTVETHQRIAGNTRALPPQSRAKLSAQTTGKGPLVFVQAGSFRSKENADSVRNSLKKLGQVYVYPAEIRGTMWYRVRLGPYRENSTAREALARTVESGAAGARIVRN